MRRRVSLDTVNAVLFECRGTDDRRAVAGGVLLQLEIVGESNPHREHVAPEDLVVYDEDTASRVLHLVHGADPSAGEVLKIDRELYRLRRRALARIPEPTPGLDRQGRLLRPGRRRARETSSVSPSGGQANGSVLQLRGQDGPTHGATNVANLPPSVASRDGTNPTSVRPAGCFG